MDPDWRVRVTAARRATAVRHTPELGGALLALAGCGQAVTQAVALAAAGPGAKQGGTALAVEYALPLCLLALLATVPLAVYRPVTAALVITFGNAVALASADRVTVAGAAAELIAVSWLGLAGAGVPGSGPFRRMLAAAGGAGGTAGRYLAVGLAVPFLAIAVCGQGGDSAVLLASGVPIAAGTGIAVWANRQARTGTAAGQVLADTLVAHTARGERARIARELHDVVAHHISMIAVQAEAGRLTTPGLPEAGARRFAEIGDTARAGLTEMRRLLGVLRDDATHAVPGTAAGDAIEESAGTVDGMGIPASPDVAGDIAARTASRHPQPGLAQLTELVDAARGASGAGTRLIISGPVAALDPGVELAAYRIVQEALTNARRHAPGAAADVELRYVPGALRLRVRDNGPGPDARPGAGDADRRGAERGGAKRSGHGLTGMRERALSAGGSLRTGAAPGGGFLVEATLPAQPDDTPAEVPAAASADRSLA